MVTASFCIFTVLTELSAIFAVVTESFWIFIVVTQSAAKLRDSTQLDVSLLFDIVLSIILTFARIILSCKNWSSHDPPITFDCKIAVLY